MTEIVMPEDTNHHGNAWGGRVMALIDKAAAIAAIRHCRGNVVTASIDSLVFLAPVRLGHILRLRAMVNAAFRTSIEVGVDVHSEDPRTGSEAHCCSAFATMVSLDADGLPQPAPPLLARTAEERRRARQASVRRSLRLEARRRDRHRTSRIPRNRAS